MKETPSQQPQAKESPAQPKEKETPVQPKVKQTPAPPKKKEPPAVPKEESQSKAKKAKKNKSGCILGGSWDLVSMVISTLIGVTSSYKYSYLHYNPSY